MKRIYEAEFKYTPAAQTDLRKTFARLRREQSAADKRAAAERLEMISRTVTPFRGR